MASIEPSRDLVLKKLRHCFPDADEAAAALAIVDYYGKQPWHREIERVQLAILMESGGSLERLRRIAELADRDYRDALVGAEYPEQFRAPSTATPEEKGALMDRDRQRYEAWLASGGD
jgi:hypothetical protein